MASIAIQVMGDEVGELTVGFSLEGSGPMRILTAYGYYYSQNRDSKLPPLTPTEIVEMMAKELLGQALDNTARFEKDMAAQAARDAVQPIEAVPQDM